MAVYVIAQMNVHDRERYARYSAAFHPTLTPYEGKLLAVDESPIVMEGEWPYRKVVLISFPDEERAKAWADGPEYAAIIGDRRAASETLGLMVHGFPVR